MKHKKIIALLTAAAIMGSLAGCKAGNRPGQAPADDGQVSPPVETQAPVESNATQAVGRVTSIDGSKITIENGELKARTPGSGSKGSGNRKDRSGDRTRPTGDNNRENRSFGSGYTFNAIGGNSTFDLSGLTQITIENDTDDTPDTIGEIKTGDVVVIEVGKDGKATSLTVKSLSGRQKNRTSSGGSIRRTKNSGGNRRSDDV